MLRTAIAAASLLAISGTASAYQFQDVITGADMTGMEVTAKFADGSTSTAIWKTSSKDAGVANGEGFAGGAYGEGWSLTQQGYTLGNIDDDKNVLGSWTIKNAKASELVKLSINGASGNIVFDNILDSVGTPGSNIGRPFLAENDKYDPTANYSASFSNQDLWSRLDINLSGFASGSSLSFLADTDKVMVAEPATLGLLTLGIFGLINRRRRA